VGSLTPGSEADFVLLDPRAAPLLARRATRANSLAQWLFAFIVLADERCVREVHLATSAAMAA